MDFVLDIFWAVESIYDFIPSIKNIKVGQSRTIKIGIYP